MVMVLAGKVFRLVKPFLLSEIVSMLENYRVEEQFEEGEQRFGLITEIVHLTPQEDSVHVLNRAVSMSLKY